MNWMIGCRKTRYTGIFKIAKGYRIRVRATDPRTGALKEANREYEGIDLKTALLRQEQMRDEIRHGVIAAERLRVGEYAKLWIESKGPTVDLGTAERYADALDDHVLPALGPLFYDQLTSLDVQKWVNSERKKGYRAETIKGWFRVLRTMTRDAIDPLGLPRDPTLRITFPEDEERDDNALNHVLLATFLVNMERLYPQHFALVVVLASPACASVMPRRFAGRTSIRSVACSASCARTCGVASARCRERSGRRATTRFILSSPRSFESIGEDFWGPKLQGSSPVGCSRRRRAPCARRASCGRHGELVLRSRRLRSASRFTGSVAPSTISPGARVWTVS
jgi:hypothetical protein